MILRIVKWGVIGGAGMLALGGVLFGSELVSYMGSSFRGVRTAVRDAVPLEFELKRARDMLADIVPEMQANVRLIAQEEVEIASLKNEIERGAEALERERRHVARLRETLDTRLASYEIGGFNYSRDQVRDDLARRFERLKESEMVLEGKQRLLTNREKSLQAAIQLLERTRSQKVHLEDKIQTLESQYRLVKAASIDSKFQVDQSSLARAENLIGDIKKRLDVAERVLAHEARFVDPIVVDVIDEADLLAQIDEHLGSDQRSHQPATRPASVMSRSHGSR